MDLSRALAPEVLIGGAAGGVIAAVLIGVLRRAGLAVLSRTSSRARTIRDRMLAEHVALVEHLRDDLQAQVTYFSWKIGEVLLNGFTSISAYLIVVLLATVSAPLTPPTPSLPTSPVSWVVGSLVAAVSTAVTLAFMRPFLDLILTARTLHRHLMARSTGAAADE